MKKAEMIKLLKFLNSYYQQKFEYPKPDKEDSKMIEETWYMFLEDYDYSIIRTAAKKIVIEKEWPPTPGEVVREIEKLKMPDEEKLSGQEAWGKVIGLIRRYGVQYEREKILENITEISRAAIDAVGGLKIIGMSEENETYLMSNFVRAYESYQERKQEKQMLPGKVKKDIGKIGRPDVEQLADNFKGDNQ
jgi:hypothetical protein